MPDRCSLTIIELEATKSVALISCRKYLPEDPNEIVAAFRIYLDRLIRQCRSSADPRESEFIHLKQRLSEAKELVVTTAGALRSSAILVEELPLMGSTGFRGCIAAGEAGRPRRKETGFLGCFAFESTRQTGTRA